MLLALGFMNQEGRSFDFENELSTKLISNKNVRNNF
jgi:hypothetical protein